MSAVRSAIVGMARTRTPFVKNRTSLQMHTDLAIEAAQDAGVRKAEIDGVLTAGCDDPTYCEDVAHSAVFCEYAGLKPRYTYTVDIGTPAFAKMIEIGADALAARRCNVLLIACAEPTVSKGSRKSAVEKMAAFGHPEFEVPFGVSIPAFYGLIARRFMHEFGLTQEQMATVAVTMREHASRNPASRFRDPITVADVISSPMIGERRVREDVSRNVSPATGCAARDQPPEVPVRGWLATVMAATAGVSRPLTDDPPTRGPVHELGRLPAAGWENKAVAINEGSLLPGTTVAAYAGDLTSLIVTNGNLYGRVLADRDVVLLRVLGRDGVFGDVGVSPLRSANLPYDARRNQLPPGVGADPKVNGVRVTAGRDLVSVEVPNGFVFDLPSLSVLP